MKRKQVSVSFLIIDMYATKNPPGAHDVNRMYIRWSEDV